METPRTERILLFLLGFAAIAAMLGCAVAVAVLGHSAAWLRPGACKPAAKPDQLGQLLFEVPRVPGAEEPWDFAPHLPESPAGAPAGGGPTGEPPPGEAPAGAAPQGQAPPGEKP